MTELQAAGECLVRSSKSRAYFSLTLLAQWTSRWTSSRKSWFTLSGSSFTSTVSGQHLLLPYIVKLLWVYMYICPCVWAVGMVWSAAAGKKCHRFGWLVLANGVYCLPNCKCYNCHCTHWHWTYILSGEPVR